jgi:predicted naringenin-chalcone synthase
MKKNYAHIGGIGTSFPYPISTSDVIELTLKIRKKFGQSEADLNRMKEIILAPGIKTRHVSHSFYLKPDDPRKLAVDARGVTAKRDIFTPYDFNPPAWERASIFKETAVPLAVEAAKKALQNWGGNPKDISHIFTTCTSGWSEPGISATIINELGLSHQCQKAELNFNGCFCGATCLRLGNDAMRASDSKAVLIVAAETASNHSDFHTLVDDEMVASALFADGAAAIVLTAEGKWRYTETGMWLVPDSLHLLGLNPPLTPDKTAYSMTLHPSVGTRLGQYFREGEGKELLKKFHPDRTQPAPALAVHPGGPNILQHLNKVFPEFGWKETALHSSFHSLQSIGNLGSAAMLFVLAERIQNIEENRLITLAFGPGVTVEWAILEKSDT